MLVLVIFLNMSCSEDLKILFYEYEAVIPFSGSSSAVSNYGYGSSSANLTFGPTAEPFTSKMFLYRDVTTPSQLYLFIIHNKDGAGTLANTVQWNITISNNPFSIPDPNNYIPLKDDDDGTDTYNVVTIDAATRRFECSWTYTKNTDGMVIGPLDDDYFSIHVDIITFGDIISSTFYYETGESIDMPASFTLTYP